MVNLCSRPQPDSLSSEQGLVKAATSDFFLPESEWLVFPPFPQPPSEVVVQSFEAFTCPGDEDEDDMDLVEHDSHDIPLVTLGIAHDPASKDAGAEARWAARSLKKRLWRRLDYEDCWKIGEDNRDWVEPEQTTQHVYDLISPPFERLLLATRNFLMSRHSAFQNTINKLMFESFRSALNIRLDFPGQHWPAPAMDVSESEEKHEEDHDGEDVAPVPEEICIFLRDPVTSVRGFLAVARKEAEATWVLDRALTLSSIVSAFLSFLHHYNVLPDPNIRPGFLEALQIAGGCRKALLQADWLERALDDIKGFNMASWSVRARAKELGREENAMHKAAPQLLEDANGWDVTATEAGPPKNVFIPEPLTAAQASPLVEEMIHRATIDSLHLKHQIDYGRRIITSVHPPASAGVSEETPFQKQLVRLDTAPAPWTPEEKWRQRRPRQSLDDEEDETEEQIFEDPEFGPRLLCIWVSPSALDDLAAEAKDDLVGMGLRGAWSQIGSETVDIWLFRAKDCE